MALMHQDIRKSFKGQLTRHVPVILQGKNTYIAGQKWHNIYLYENQKVLLVRKANYY